MLVAAGLAARPAGITGAAIITAVCAVYLTRLAVPGRRDRPGIAGLTIFGACAITVLVLQIAYTS